VIGMQGRTNFADTALLLRWRWRGLKSDPAAAYTRRRARYRLRVHRELATGRVSAHFGALLMAAIMLPLSTLPSLAQMPGDLFGQWSTDKVACEDNQGEGVTVFGIGPREIGWYEINCDVRNIRPTKDGVFLRVDCEKGGGSKGSGDIDIRRINPDILDVYVSPMSFSGELRYQLRRCQSKVAASNQPPTFWNHNGSTMYLLVKGSSREFYYERPRMGILEAGARRGALLFSGEVMDNAYQGVAYVFKGFCGQFPYQVSGPILDGGRRVVLRGQAPRVNAECQITGYLTDVLEFSLIDR
jgi:hypothetical protein